MNKIYGINPVREAVKKNSEIERIEIYEGVNKNKFEEILNLCKKNEIKVDYVKERKKGTQGVVAYLKKYDYVVDEWEFLEKLAGKKESTVLVLDNIQDPRNFGALIRSADAFGVDGIIIPEKRSVKINETVVKTSTGAIEHVSIVIVKNLVEFMKKLKKIDFWVYGAEADGKNYYTKEKYANKTCLVLGSEGQGIRKLVKENCDIMVQIPMVGNVNSLNVSVAGGILLSQILLNRRG